MLLEAAMEGVEILIVCEIVLGRIVNDSEKLCWLVRVYYIDYVIPPTL